MAGPSPVHPEGVQEPVPPAALQAAAGWGWPLVPGDSPRAGLLRPFRPQKEGWRSLGLALPGILPGLGSCGPSGRQESLVNTRAPSAVELTACQLDNLILGNLPGLDGGRKRLQGRDVAIADQVELAGLLGG